MRDDLVPDLDGTLGAVPNADAEQTASAYRTAGRRAHPDAGGSNHGFIVVDFAWRLLRNGDTRLRQAEDIIRRATERNLVYFCEAAVTNMAQWSLVRRDLRASTSLKGAGADLAEGYRIYTTLRKLHELIDGSRAVLTVEELGLCLNVSDAVIEIEQPSLISRRRLACHIRSRTRSG